MQDATTEPGSADMPVHVAMARLRVRDLAAMTEWYAKAIGLAVLSRDGETAVLGAGDRAFLTLLGDPHARPAADTAPGLFHNAFLVPDRAALAGWLVHAAESDLGLSGASDHLVSEALYLDDPEGNGIEIYRDRPRADWPRGPGGEIQMATRPLDLKALAGEAPATGFTGMVPGTVLGHIHLKVNALQAADAFFDTGLAIAREAAYPGAYFFGSGGYHHHVGANVWRTQGAGTRESASTGLLDYTLHFADPAERDRAAARLEAGNVELTRDDGRIGAPDPAGVTAWLVA